MKRTVMTLIAALSLLTLFSFGCEQTDLGRYCVVGFDPATGGDGVKAINAEAPECLQRLCVLQSRMVLEGDAEVSQTVQYCSQKCGSDSECKGGEKPEHCDSGFVCIRMGAETGALDGKGICECRNFLTEADLCLGRYKASDRNNDDSCTTAAK
ncbi:hypothetical protein KKD52_03520 [Myxococcota bacterium]|nr:hypothetical protein [Myxococcota bacterium]MBU1413484.1 hypothetical protein [Myxococcota bacterium]MBU1509409.1 hypothetical protein [Myxococcota bacterium]